MHNKMSRTEMIQLLIIASEQDNVAVRNALTIVSYLYTIDCKLVYPRGCR